MLRGYLHFKRNLAFAGIAALALCAGLAISAPTYADSIDTGTATGGSTDAGAGASGQGSASAGIGATTTTDATSDGSGGSAGTTTSGNAGASQNGENGNTSADANTLAQAGVTADGTDLTAEALAAANAGGTSKTDDGGLAKADSDSLAYALAKNGDAPSAFALAGSDTWALAIGGANYSATALAGLDSIIETKNGKWRKITIAYTKDGQYSVAIASPWRATAFASTYGNGGAFTVDDIFAAVKTAAKAFATAGKHDASAWAEARARGIGGNQFGVSSAASASRAGAFLHIEITRSGSPGAGTASFLPGACTLTVSDWKKWKKLSLAQRKKHVHCGCPPAQKVKFGQRLNSNACGISASFNGSAIRLRKKK